MGQPRWRSRRIAEKLLQIRKTLKLSQPEILKELGLEEEISYNRISEYERDKYDPPLPVLLEYARVARVSLEDIVEDRLDLPEDLPGTATGKAWHLPRLKRQKTKKAKKAKK
jgi:transcriptional regulator with XRE-family HTH domain